MSGRLENDSFKLLELKLNLEGNMADKIQNAYQTSKNLEGKGSLKNAHITCIGYSMDMLEQARKRLGSFAHSQLSGISNGTSSAIHTGSLFPTFS